MFTAKSIGLVIFAAVATMISGATAMQSSAPSQWAETDLGWQPTLLVQLAVSDLDRAVQFYHEVLEFDLESRNDNLQWVRMKCGISGVTIGLGVQEKVTGSGSVSLNFAVDDIEKARRILESRGVVFLGPTTVIPGVVKLADFLDPDGNKIRLAGHPG